MMINSLTQNGSSAPLGAWVAQEAGRVLGGVGLLGLLAFLLGDTFSEPASLKGIRSTLMAPDSCLGLPPSAPGAAVYRSSALHHRLAGLSTKSPPMRAQQSPLAPHPSPRRVPKSKYVLNPQGSLPSLGGRRTRSLSLGKRRRGLLPQASPPPPAGPPPHPPPLTPPHAEPSCCLSFWAGSQKGEEEALGAPGGRDQGTARGGGLHRGEGFSLPLRS